MLLEFYSIGELWLLIIGCIYRLSSSYNISKFFWGDEGVSLLYTTSREPMGSIDVVEYDTVVNFFHFWSIFCLINLVEIVMQNTIKF